MKTDIQIAQQSRPQHISEVAKQLGLDEQNLIFYGEHKAKLKNISHIDKGKLILVTAISPTPAGEGKTTISVGLADALHYLQKSTCLALREPSLGPVFGVKGGATGGGYSQVVPMEDINLHFTGDLHAITSANNLLAALLDNHIFHGNTLNIDVRRIVFKRCIDMNDRQLRFVLDGMNGKTNGMPREDGFDITVASEVMAIFCLAQSLADLKERLGKIVVAYSYTGEMVTAGQLNAAGAMAALLKDAFKPNLVQTLEHTPAIIHGGPFANIAHGCNSVVATKAALSLADYVVTEAGFGADLGAEKFLDIKCRATGLLPSAVVIVATVRALKHHGGCEKSQLAISNVELLQKGMGNLLQHIDNIKNLYGLPVCVAINAFASDSDSEHSAVKAACAKLNVPCEIATIHSEGGKGGVALANAVLSIISSAKIIHPYELSDDIHTKINKLTKAVYRATSVNFSPAAEKNIQLFEQNGFSNLPICVAKTQYSFSDNQKLLCAPKDFIMTVRDVRLSAGAGFIVVIMGDIMTMPGLPKIPAANTIDIDNDGVISGLF